jgi:hypothetical protein
MSDVYWVQKKICAKTEVANIPGWVSSAGSANKLSEAG